MEGGRPGWERLRGPARDPTGSLCGAGAAHGPARLPPEPLWQRPAGRSAPPPSHQAGWGRGGGRKGVVNNLNNCLINYLISARAWGSVGSVLPVRSLSCPSGPSFCCCPCQRPGCMHSCEAVSGSFWLNSFSSFLLSLFHYYFHLGSNALRTSGCSPCTSGCPEDQRVAPGRARASSFKLCLGLIDLIEFIVKLLCKLTKYY